MLPPNIDPRPRPSAYSVSITYPKDNTTIEIKPDGLLEIRGSIFDDDGIVDRVEVKIGTNNTFKKASLSGESWIFAEKVGEGIIDSITAKAAVGSSQSKSDSVKNITVKVNSPSPSVNNPPFISFDSYIDGHEFKGTTDLGAIVRLSGTSSDDLGIKEVRLRFGDDEIIANKDIEGWAKWSASYVVKKNGSMPVIATAIDTMGLKSNASANIIIQLVNPDTSLPSIHIGTPIENTIFQGSKKNGFILEVKGTAEDRDSGIREVRVKVGSNEERSARPIEEGNWKGGWIYNDHVDTDGQIEIKATAVDFAGNSSSDLIRISVAFIDSDLKGPHLLLAETYQMTSYLGSYGAGRTIKTLTLLPGEKTKIGIKTYKSLEETRKASSTILDEYAEEKEVEFSNQLSKEQTDKSGSSLIEKYEAEVKVEASWGFGSASLGGGMSSDSNTSREELAKNISNITQKQISQASAKRNINIQTSNELKEETKDELSYEQEIENVNVSRTLNFVFRQMNQEFYTFTHLVDIRLLYININSKNETDWIYKEFPLYEMDNLLVQFVKPDKIVEVKQSIINELYSIRDYKFSIPQNNDFIKKVTLPNKKEYYTINKDYVTEFDIGIEGNFGGTKFKIPGILMDYKRYVIRTDGIIVDALLGHGDALDDYAHGLQDESVKAKKLANDLLDTEIQKNRLAMEIIRAKDATAAETFAKVFPDKTYLVKENINKGSEEVK